MSLKIMLKGNMVAMGKNYYILSAEELKFLLSLKCMSNSNNYIVGTNKTILIHLLSLDKRTFDKHLKSLIDKGFILVHGEINKCSNIEILKDNTFELFNVEFILDMINDLTPAEIKLFCAMSTFLNVSKNRNYIYPSIESIAKEYYNRNLSSEELEIKVKNKGIDKLKNKLIEKGYIKKVVPYFFETKNGKKGRSSLGYFLKTGMNEVSSTEYMNFVNNQIELYNSTHNNYLRLANEEYLIKCKYKNLDKYFCYRSNNDMYENIPDEEYFEYENKPRKIKQKKSIFEFMQ